MRRALVILFLVVVLVGCTSGDYVPKPRGYMRIDMPEKGYVSLCDSLPYVFDVPEYSVVKSVKNTEDWVNVEVPELRSVIYLSYWKIKGDPVDYFEDARRMVYKHTIKAESILETPFENSENGVYGILYEIEGNAASNVQFVLTDSTNHFLRGALYFMSRPNIDSVRPVMEFMKEDIKQLMNTCKFKD
jgi:gliding motility-associated lipoprotein GldD